MKYEIIRSNRKTAAIQVKADGTVVVRAPGCCPSGWIEEFVKAHEGWVKEKLEQLRQAENENRLQLKFSEEEKREYRRRAKELFTKKTAYYAEQMGVTYGIITIREQKTRWGSCSGAGNLNFNWRLLLAPEEVLDYVVVHELAHRREMNHSRRFYQVVEQIMPDYQSRREWLRKNGRFLL